MKEFCLSDFSRDRERGYGNVYAEKYVKEFIKKLKEEMIREPLLNKAETRSVLNKINKLAGEKLIYTPQAEGKYKSEVVTSEKEDTSVSGSNKEAKE